MFRRLTEILRVYLLRPWVWFMGAMALFQIVPAWVLSGKGIGNAPIVVLPEFQTPEGTVTSSQLLGRAAEGTLGAIRALDLTEQTPNFFPVGPFRVVQATSGPGQVIEPVGEPGTIPLIPYDGLGILSHTPSLRWLRADFRMFSTDSLRRLGNLTELETLSLRTAGSTDSTAVMDVPRELPAALARLTRLEQLDLRGAFAMEYRLPPLPKLQFVALGPKLHLEEDLRTLAEHSPGLSAIVLSGYPQFELTPAMRESLGRMRNLRTVYLHDIPDQELVRRSLRQALPGISFPRTSYVVGRVFGGLYVMLGGMFPVMILWVQTLIAFSLPLSRTLPGFTRPHLVPAAAMAALMVVIGMSAAVWLGIHPLVAFALVLSGTGVTLNPQPAVDLTPLGTVIARLIVGWRITMIGLFLLMAFAFQPALDAVLTGEIPWVPCVSITVEVLAAIWVLGRLRRQACVLAEQGQNVIPGMVHVDHFALADPSVARKSGPTRSLIQWADLLLERLLAKPQPSLWALLRGGNARVIWYARGGMIILLVALFSLIVGPRLGNTFEDRLAKTVPFLAFQTGMMFVIWAFIQWIGRRPTLAAEFTRPVTRESYFGGLWRATAADLAQVLGMLFVMASLLFVIMKANPGYWGALVFGTSGAFLVLHGYLIWILTARRLWVPLVAGAAACTTGIPTLVFLAAILQPGGTRAPGPFTPIALLGAMLALNAIGIGIEFWQHRRCRTLELG